MLVEVKGCIFLSEQFRSAHGYGHLDAVGQEAFVNHVHIEGRGHQQKASEFIQKITWALKRGWSGRRFRIYHQTDPDESIVRFHMVRESEPNWCESGLDMVEVII